MTTVQSVIISIVEGLTEFLPVSSTAHMKITNPLIGVQIDSFEEMFEVVIQLAAILSVVTVYWKKFLDFKSPTFYIKLMLALIPAIIFGALLKKHIDSVHNKLKEFQCDKCSYASAYKGSITKHENIVHKKLLPFECQFCQKRFVIKKEEMIT